jgi:hypothetical protein
MRTIRERLMEYLAGDLIGRRLTETETRLRAEADTRVREALSAGMSRADELLMQQGFRRLTSEQSERDLTPLAQDRMLAMVHWLWESNPLAQWLAETVVDFVWGEGGRVKADDARVQAIVDAFWDDPVNQLDLRMDSFVRELGLDGELALPVFVNDFDGHVRLGYLEPSEIAEVVTHPENALIAETVALKSRATGERPRLYKVVRADDVRSSATFGQLMPALWGERDLHRFDRPYDGSCCLFQVNQRSAARRGRSDLLSLIDWLDGYDAFLFDGMDRAQLLGAFIWDVTLKGMDEAQIKAWLKDNATVRRGAIRAHNEGVEWKAEGPTLQSYELDALARLLRGHILGARSIPEHYYGLGGEVNLATAKEMGLPTMKRMSRRQKTVRHVILFLCRFAVHQAKVHGVLPKDADETLTVELPEISMRDTSAITTAMTQLTVALGQAEERGWIRRETSARLFALLASQLGSEVKADEEVTPEGEPTPAERRDYERDPAKVRDLRDRLGDRP